MSYDMYGRDNSSGVRTKHGCVCSVRKRAERSRDLRIMQREEEFKYKLNYKFFTIFVKFVALTWSSYS